MMLWAVIRNDFVLVKNLFIFIVPSHNCVEKIPLCTNTIILVQSGRVVAVVEIVMQKSVSSDSK